MDKWQTDTKYNYDNYLKGMYIPDPEIVAVTPEDSPFWQMLSPEERLAMASS